MTEKYINPFREIRSSLVRKSKKNALLIRQWQKPNSPPFFQGGAGGGEKGDCNALVVGRARGWLGVVKIHFAQKQLSVITPITAKNTY